MERLTRRENGKVCVTDRGNNYKEDVTDVIIKALHKLADYEDAEEYGLLVRLPCKVGDTVYHLKEVYKGKKIIDTIIEPIILDSFTIGDLGRPQSNTCDTERNIWAYYDIMDFGKTVFLNREEAEQALEDMCNE